MRSVFRADEVDEGIFVQGRVIRNLDLTAESAFHIDGLVIGKIKTSAAQVRRKMMREEPEFDGLTVLQFDQAVLNLVGSGVAAKVEMFLPS